MRTIFWFIFLGMWFGLSNLSKVFAEEGGLSLKEWMVDDTPRQALVWVPKMEDKPKAPVVLVFHGHGGTMQHSARVFDLHQWWPEAVVIYAQGMKTPGKITDPEGRRFGWQHGKGEQGDRDLKFFDAILQWLEKKKIGDLKSVFVTGHSNGGAFSYLLWAERGEKLRALAPSGAIAPLSSIGKLKPKPVLHVAGQKDPLVKYAWQYAMIQKVLEINQCEPAGARWEGSEVARFHESKTGMPTVLMVHPGGHEHLREAPSMTVKFFKFCLELNPKKNGDTDAMNARE